MAIPAFNQAKIDADYLESLRYSHDLRLPDWGPYTKKYIGVSHISDHEQGIRFDLSVFPGFYRRKVTVPNVFYESGFHPWEASPNLEYFSFRHELEWKDRVYTDVAYTEIDDQSRLVRIDAVNNTDAPQSIVLHLMGSIHFPSIREYQPHTPIELARVKLPAGGLWVDAVDYQNIHFTKSSPKDNLVTDGKMLGEIRDHGLVNGNGLANNFGARAGDRVAYSIPVTENLADAVLIVRYQLPENETTSFQLDGLSRESIQLEGKGDFALKRIELGKLSAGTAPLSLTAQGGSGVTLDGFAILESSRADQLEIEAVEWDPVPEILEGPVANSLILKYKNIDAYYGLYWDYADYQIRQWNFKDLGDEFKRMVNEHVATEFFDGTKGHFTNVFLRPIALQPHETRTINGLVCTGSREAVSERLAKAGAIDKEAVYQAAREHLVDYQAVPAGERYLFSQDRMAANVICNVVYPVYTQRQYIRHHAPGRWWDCLYTWDAGFIGIGLSQLDIQRGIENLNAYLNETDEQSTFIHHGSTVPVQHYLFQELWNKTQSDAVAAEFYPKLKRYYEFMLGKYGSSSTRNMKSNLLRPWDYFYNSGGWDDYPPQKHVRYQQLNRTVTPVVTTAHSIRIAKILKQAALHLGKKADVKILDEEIKMLSDALQEYAWDPETNYFGYVQHDENGQPLGILKYEDKINYNMGLGGAYPLFSGICTDEQQAAILEHLKTKGKIWSDVGLSAVDQSAPYYSKEGYWNGTVWMPHQWFYWKTMLDLGEADFAWRIAHTALEVWKRETEKTYNCFEHFIIETGTGAGWHQFSGLSSPVLSWFSAYFRPGNLTTGYNIWIERQEWAADKSGLEAELQLLEKSDSPLSLVVCLDPDQQYRVLWNEREIPHRQLHAGTLSITFTPGKAKGTLRVEKI
ncbi:MGH1-like glycoside hydrolase domain-containing protein [Flavilitoribacter nigricans]|uniref:Mannosylglycerate hydrolase MGH1-like glycoside hydrolase domain-containing protein n=1 Tax=Flavilitoribacter nigricans (strain ATCC 23147 / DSM 23189 / NBRC 102662 / NCIMB 1420 / SS-2) TaxID=1122177 RepID=A0A2D0NDF2_FLAN2|nr:trehalase family glycosidase [Flavilitoribacter nigricans]PHN06544.1 hypothetical protein CRP01_09575 [Flavilitoribacter nigricans DSM 23189 = NBRC 102662]